MLVYRDKLTCSHCISLWQDSLERRKKNTAFQERRPQCWSKPCKNAIAHIEGVDEWINLLAYVQQGQELGLSKEILEWAGALDQETVEMLISLRLERDRLISEKQEAEIAMQKQKVTR